MSKKGIVINYLCNNPNCDFSDNMLIDKQPLTGTNNKSFKVLNVCPKCKASLELINFVSGTIDIQKDNI